MRIQSLVGILMVWAWIGPAHATKLPALAHLTTIEKHEYIFDREKISAVWTGLLPHKLGELPVFPPQAGPPTTMVYGILSDPIYVDGTEQGFIDELKLTDKFVQVTSTISPQYPLYLKATAISVIMPASNFGTRYGPKVKTLIFTGAGDPWQVLDDPATVEAAVDKTRSKADSP